MLVAAAICPHPPLLLPGVDPGEGGDGADLRAACLEAVGSLTQGSPGLLVVVGSSRADGGSARDGPFPPDAWGSLAPYGVKLSVGERAGPPALPLSLTVGRWLVGEAAAGVPWLFFGVPDDREAGGCARLGADLADRAERVALLAMGDGTARRSRKGPGYLDERAAPFDAQVAQAVSTGDHDALLGLDSGLARELLVAGRAPWQVLAGAARAAGGAWEGRVTYAAAPFGVGYVVGTWSRR